MPDQHWYPDWLIKSREKRNKGMGMVHETSRAEHDLHVDDLTRDVAFNRHSMNDGHHVSPSDNGMIAVGTDAIRVALAQGIDEEAFKRTLSAATRATVGLDLSQGDALDVQDDWTDMLKGGLQTALETQVIVFAVGGVSRTATHQLVRSRRAAFHQQSQRAGYMGDMPEVRIPESVWVKPRARQAFLRSIIEAHDAYRIACEEDVAYQDARFILPEGTTNFILLEYPVREFLNVYAYRACSMFQWEIVDVMRKCREVLIEAHPWLEPYVKISCEKTGPAVITTTTDVGMPHQASCDITRGDACSCGSANVQQTVPHHCTFQGWEDVEGQCSFSWAKHEARTFKPKFHRITREKSNE